MSTVREPLTILLPDTLSVMRAAGLPLMWLSLPLVELMCGVRRVFAGWPPGR
jgi:hypothetical protein